MENQFYPELYLIDRCQLLCFTDVVRMKPEDTEKMGFVSSKVNQSSNRQLSNQNNGIVSFPLPEATTILLPKRET